jgi:hypothetical protein
MLLIPSLTHRHVALPGSRLQMDEITKENMDNEPSHCGAAKEAS